MRKYFHLLSELVPPRHDTLLLRDDELDLTRQHPSLLPCPGTGTPSSSLTITTLYLPPTYRSHSFPYVVLFLFRLSRLNTQHFTSIPPCPSVPYVIPSLPFSSSYDYFLSSFLILFSLQFLRCIHHHDLSSAFIFKITSPLNSSST